MEQITHSHYEEVSRGPFPKLYSYHKSALTCSKVKSIDGATMHSTHNVHYKLRDSSFACVNNIACSGIRKLKVDWVFMYHEWGWLRLRPARLCSHLDVLYPGRAGEGAVPTNAPSLCLNSNNGPRSAVLPSWEYWPRWELSIGHLNFDIRNKISFNQLAGQNANSITTGFCPEKFN